MPKWPNPREARRLYRVVAELSATPFRADLFNADEEYVDDPEIIHLDTPVYADPRFGYDWMGKRIIVFSRGESFYFTGYDEFMASVESGSDAN